jgi:beta-lactam-binding protein with PASTA domain/tRNA A-37 threonylcarbamoyl transferase component Bud32
MTPAERNERTLKPGDVVAGRYRLQELIGEGAAALVFRATDEALGRDVAVKVLRVPLATSPAAADRFRAEGRAAAIVAHPNVAAVFDVAPDGESPAIVMEFVDGEDLASMLRRVGPLVPRRAAAVAAQVARGLAAAHVRGIIHRDVSSRNILINREGRAQIADFGIAQAMHEVDGSEAAARSGQRPEGSVGYLAPEVLAGGPQSASSDLFGLGVVLFELLTGHRPFDSLSGAALKERRVQSPAPSPRELRPDISQELDLITTRLLAPKPNERYANATAAADALETYVVQANRTAVPSRPVGPAAGAPRALAGTRVARVAAEAGPGEPEMLPDPNDVGGEDPSDAGDTMSLRTMILAIGGVALTALLLVGGVILALRIFSAGTGPDNNVKVPSLTTLTLAEAIPLAEGLGLRVQVVERVTSSDQPVDTILSQSPGSETLVPLNTVIEVRVVAGSGFVVVPDIRGMSEADGIAALAAVKLIRGATLSEYSDIVPAGEVLQQNPRPGVQVSSGTAIDVVISLGVEPSPSPSVSPSPSPSGADWPQVPDLHCSSVADATTLLSLVGLSLDSASALLNPTDRINTFSPLAGVFVAPGSEITIVTSAPAGTPIASCP